MSEGRRRVPYFYAPPERGPRVIDRTAEAAAVLQTKDGRNIHSGGNPNARRRTDVIDSVMLHHTTFESSDIARFDHVIANYVVLRNGRVLKLRGLEVALNSIGTNQRAIDIEFEGSYPGRGRIRRERRAMRRDGLDDTLHERLAPWLPPLDQIVAGRELVRLLQRIHNVRHVFAHSQFTAKNCPGPHLWYNVGEWATRILGLGSGGRGSDIPRAFTHDSLAIPPLPSRDEHSERSLVGPPRGSGAFSSPNPALRVPGRAL